MLFRNASERSVSSCPITDGADFPRGKEKNVFKFKTVIAASFAAVFLLGSAVPASASTDKSFREIYADTSFRLLKNTAKAGKNCMISPVSALVAVNTAQIGSSGRTRREMEKAFGGLKTKKATTALSKLTKRVSGSKAVTFRSPCAVWSAKGAVTVKKSYTRAIQKAYDAEVKSVEFNSDAVSEINDWVSDKTEKKIPSIINQLDPLDRVVIVNATYFKGDWADPYTGSVKRKFTRRNGSTKKVPMLEGSEHEYFEVGGAKCFAKPYSGGTCSFVAILPKKGTSIKSFLAKTSGSEILKAYTKRKTSDVLVKTRIPKFKHTFSASLKTPLKKLGIRTAFSDTATFHYLTNTGIHIDDILHKTFIALDEKGTEAAAVTAVVMKANSMFIPSPEVKTVYLNRPFIYEIVETKTGLPLFVGIVNDP